jgi:hypothetical protein
LAHTSGLPQTGFGESLSRCNGLDETGFGQWVFYPGMLFGAQAKWWGGGGDRDRRHEGLDLYLYRDKAGRIHNLDDKIEVPVTFAGRVVKVAKDFLGQSVYVEHGIIDGQGKVLYTVYGHVEPHIAVSRGATLNEGRVFATIARGSVKRRSVPPPHLHISVAWIPESFPQERLNWDVLSDCGTVQLLDPLGFVGEKYEVMDWVPEVTG